MWGFTRTEPMDKVRRRSIESYRQGGKKAAETNKKLYGSDFYKKNGALGGKSRNPNKGFGSNRELASRMGAVGGAISRRTKVAK